MGRGNADVQPLGHASVESATATNPFLHTLSQTNGSCCGIILFILRRAAIYFLEEGDCWSSARWLTRLVCVGQMNDALASKANVTSVQGILDRLDSSRESAVYSTQEISNMVSTLREEVTTKVGMREVRPATPARTSSPAA